MANFVSFSNVPANEDCSWYSSCDFQHLCADCSKCGIGCPAYYPYTSEVVRVPAAAAVEEVDARATGFKTGFGTQGDRTDELRLLPQDTEITIRVFTDRTLVEAYWMDGRVAMTSATKPGESRAGLPQIEVFSSVDGVELGSATVWEMQSIWVSKEEVLAAPRVDGLQK